MAKINNQEVVQKLIDELKLYPGADAIPTEIADKILAVYQINSDSIEVTTTPSTIVRSADQIDGTFANETMYTVPSTGSFFLTNLALSSNNAAAAAIPGYVYIEVTPKNDSSAREILAIAMELNDSVPSNTSLNLQNPLELEPGSTIALKGSANIIDGDIPTHASMVGYTTD
jgi:hypothetical protein